MGDNVEALRRVIEDGFGAGDLSVADEFAGPTIIEHEYGAPSAQTGSALLKAMITEARTQMPGLTMSVEDAVADGDKVWARSVGRAPGPRPGQTLTITVLDVCRFEHGRIIEHWGVPDRFALLDQLGVLPPPPSA
jgi:predicted ester cyclase